MSNPIDDTRGQTPDDVRRLPHAPFPMFAAGDPVPGLSSWLLERKLGGGGFGEVWLARHDLRNEPPRAVKFCLHPEIKNRLVTHEKNVVARVMKYAGGHPNVVPLLEYNLDGDIPWLMYEYVEGGTLADQIEQRKSLPLPKRLGWSVRVLHAIAGALGTFHRFDPPLVHRDMKPHNVLMAGTVPRITDFGIGSVAVPTDADTGGQTALAARLPSAMHRAGTRGYAPPEQVFFGRPPHPRDDVYALGVIAYQMVLGDLHAGPGSDATLELRDLGVPGELPGLIVRSVAANPDRRPADANEWASVLAGIVEKAQKKPEAAASSVGSRPVLLPEPPPVARPLARPVRKPTRPEHEPASPSRWKGLALALGGGLLLALIVAGVWAAWSSGKRSDPTSPAERAEKPDGVSKPKDTPPEPMAKPPAPKRPTTPVPGEARDIEIAPGVKMAFCWVPASGGEVQLGSPKSGRDLVLKAAPESKQAGWLASEAEGVRGKFKTGGFWMGQYEVTQAEWKAVVGDNPSYFDGTKDNKAKGMDTSRFPVESVSWDRICGRGKYAGTGFLDKIDHGGIRRALGTAGRFRLPTENEWEYACRGGRGNGRAFFWGDALNGTQANCCGSVFPFGTAEKGAYLGRPCPVDFTGDGKYKPHPWGLMHMHGNVYEWCEDFYDTKDNGHVLRGGSWGSYGHICRAANRHGDAPDNDTSRIGFRLLALGLP